MHVWKGRRDGNLHGVKKKLFSQLDTPTSSIRTFVVL